MESVVVLAKCMAASLCAVTALIAVPAFADPLPAEADVRVEADDDAATVTNWTVATPPPADDAPLVIVGDITEVEVVVSEEPQAPTLTDPSLTDPSLTNPKWARTPVSNTKRKRSPSFGVSVGNGGTETPADQRRELRDGDW